MKSKLLGGVLVALMVVAWGSPRATAAVPGETVDWDVITERHKEVLRDYAEAFWIAWDADQAGEPVEFDFVWPADVQPGDGFDPFFLSVDTLSAVYADRLVIESGSYTYDIYDLIEDDPEVFEAFRHHTLTGELVTPLAQPQAAFRHLLFQMLPTPEIFKLLGDDEDPCTDVYYVEATGSVAVTGSTMSSEIDVMKQPKPCPGTGSPGPSPAGFEQALRDAIEDSGLAPLRTRGFREKDGLIWSPGFDCDDYADALAWWLSRKLPTNYGQPEIFQLWMRWPGIGHTLTVVCIGGNYYVIDAQTGVVRGPFSSMEAAQEGAWSIIEEYYNNEAPVSRRESTTKREPGERPFVEPGPWYTDPDIVDKFRDAMPDSDPADYAPPNWQF